MVSGFIGRALLAGVVVRLRLCGVCRLQSVRLPHGSVHLHVLDVGARCEQLLCELRHHLRLQLLDAVGPPQRLCASLDHPPAPPRLRALQLQRQLHILQPLTLTRTHQLQTQHTTATPHHHTTPQQRR